MKHLLLILFTAISISVSGQVKPHNFPVDNTPSDTDALYTQELVSGTSIARKFMLPVLKKYFSLDIRVAPIPYTPFATGNTEYLFQLVEDPEGDHYYIDGEGNSMLLYDAGVAAALADSIGVVRDSLSDLRVLIELLQETKADSFDVLQDSIIVLFALGNELMRDTVHVTGGGIASNIEFVNIYDYGATADVQLDQSVYIDSAIATGKNVLIGYTAEDTIWISRPIEPLSNTVIRINATVILLPFSAIALGANVSDGVTSITVPNSALFEEGQFVGVSDDNSAVQAGGTQTRLVGASVRILDIPNGTTLTTTEVEGDYTTTQNAYIGRLGSIVLLEQDTNVVIQGNGVLDVNWTNQIDIEGMYPIGVSLGEDVKNQSGVVIDSCHNIHVSGITIQNAGLHNLTGRQSTEVNIFNIRLIAAHDKSLLGILGGYNWNVDKVFIDSSLYEDGLSLYSGPYDSNFSNITIKGCNRHGIFANDVAVTKENQNFSNIYIENCKYMFTAESDNININNAILFAGDSTVYNFWFQDVDGGNIINTVIEGDTMAFNFGYSFEDCNDIKVNGFSIRNAENFGYALRTVGASDNIRFVNGTLENVFRGHQIGSSTTNNYFENIDFTDVSVDVGAQDTVRAEYYRCAGLAVNNYIDKDFHIGKEYYGDGKQLIVDNPYGGTDKLQPAIDSIFANMGAGGAITLADVSDDSNDAAKSLYTMTTTVDVEFESSDNNTVLYLDEADERIGIGMTTPAAKLDILGESQTGSGTVGSLLVSQTWNTSGTPSLIKGNVTNTASSFGRLLDLNVGGSPVLTVPTNGVIYFGNLFSSGSAVGPSNPSFGSFLVNGTGISLSHRATGTTVGYGIWFTMVTGTRQATSGESGNLKSNETFNPTSGSGTYIGISLTPTINQTGGASGTTRGLFIGPTLTAAADWRSLEIGNTSGYAIYQPGASATNYFNGSTGIGTTAADRLFHVEVSDAVTNAVTYANRLSHVSSGTVAASFGTGTEIELENASNTNRIAAAREYTWSDATNATEDATETLKLMRAGTLTTARTTLSTGFTGFNIAAPVSPLHVYEDNANTDSTVGLTIEQDGAGDAVAQYLLTGGQRFVQGIDNTDDHFKLSFSADVGTDNIFDASNGAFIINQHTTINGNIIVDSPDGLQFDIDGNITTMDDDVTAINADSVKMVSLTAANEVDEMPQSMVGANVTGKLVRYPITATTATLGASATTLAIDRSVITVTGDAGGNTLATITGGSSGQIITLIFVDALVTITDDGSGTADTVNLSAAFTSSANDTIMLVHDGTSWREVSRSIN